MDDFEFQRRYLNFKNLGIPSPRCDQPWGRPGCGAPCSNASRRHDLMQQNIFPHIKCDIRDYPDSSILEKRRAGDRLRRSEFLRPKDTEILFQESGRTTVENNLRWKLPTEKQLHYTKCLDEIVDFKKRLKKEENAKIARLEKSAQNNTILWGAPGPGGLPWRKPVDIGKNFHHSMGWTTEATFPVLSAVAKCDCVSFNTKERNKSSCVRFPHEDSKKIAIPCRRCGPRGSTPNRQLLKMTGGVELVPLLRARGLPSSTAHLHPPFPRKLRCRPRDEEEWKDLSDQYRKLREIA